VLYEVDYGKVMEENIFKNQLAWLLKLIEKHGYKRVFES
jgi:hypothetical protein